MEEAFKNALTFTLEYLPSWEAMKAVDPMVRVQPLIRVYCVVKEDKHKLLKEQVAVVTGQVDKLVKTISHFEKGFQTLQQECNQALSSVATAEAGLVAAEAELPQSQHALVNQCRYYEYLMEFLQKLESSMKVAQDECSQLLSSLEAHHAALLACSLSDEELEVEATEEVRRRADSEIKKLDKKTNAMLADVLNM